MRRSSPVKWSASCLSIFHEIPARRKRIDRVWISTAWLSRASRFLGEFLQERYVSCLFNHRTWIRQDSRECSHLRHGCCARPRSPVEVEEKFQVTASIHLRWRRRLTPSALGQKSRSNHRWPSSAASKVQRRHPRHFGQRNSGSLSDSRENPTLRRVPCAPVLDFATWEGKPIPGPCDQIDSARSRLGYINRIHSTKWQSR